MPPGELMFENAKIVYLNFKGAETRYNAEGDRNFSVILDPELADMLEADGWNVKRKAPREDEETGRIHLPVAVKYGKGRPPMVVLITSRTRTRMDEEDLEMLDYADIKNVDLIVRPYEWNVRGETGVKAYLKELWVTIHESVFAQKYADVPESAEIRGSSEE